VEPLSNVKILILGGSGFLGGALAHHLVRDLRTKLASIRVFYLAGTPTDSLRDLPGIELLPGNILNEEDVRSAFEGIELVFHMAGSTSFDPGRKREQWLINVEGTRNVLEAARQSAAFRKMCYTSSVNALGVPPPRETIGSLASSDPYTAKPRLHSFRSADDVLLFVEDVRQSRISNWETRIDLGYFDSKLAAQELVQSYVQRFSLNIVSVLPGTSFGPYDFLIGNGIYLLSLFHNKMPGVLRGGFSTVHVMDVVEGHVLAMERGAPGSRYIITGRPEDNLHFKDAMRIMAETLREEYPERKIRTPKLVFPPRLAGAAAFLSEKSAALRRRPCLLSRAVVKAGSQPLFYSYEDAERDLGYRPVRTFRQAIKDMIAYFRAEGLFESRGRSIDYRRVVRTPNS
jgi:dihydroflavonol-4-reductase